MDDADYATSKYIRWHRCLSIGLVLLVILIALHFNTGFRFRHWGVFVFPLILIWFSDRLSYCAIRTSGNLLNSSNVDVTLRVLGWIGLLLLIVLRFLFEYLK